MADERSEVAIDLAPNVFDAYEALQEIERLAAATFPEEDVPAPLRDEALSFERLRTGTELGLLLLACDGTVPIGFLLLERSEHDLHVAETNVLPAYARHGIGRRLVERAFALAARERAAALTLTTFDHLPWNRPFYESCGFRVVDEGALSDALADKLAAERSVGLRNRVAMRAPVSRAFTARRR